MPPVTTKTNKDPNKSTRLRRHFVRRIPKAAMALITLGLAFWLLWNWAAVPLFTFPPLTYLQGLGAILLTALLATICMLAAVRRRKSAYSALSPDDSRDWGCRFGSTWKRDI
ncbi:MAG: hypothetical protein PVG41_02775 [Desulfobacteraceae bacterium]|jgi:polyferredoxin